MGRITYVLLVLVLVLVLAQLGGNLTYAASVYKWRDANGILHFSDKPSAKHKTESVDIEVMEPSPA